jgi:hypothetical protein
LLVLVVAVVFLPAAQEALVAVARVDTEQQQDFQQQLQLTTQLQLVLAQQVAQQVQTLVQLVAIVFLAL